jgi:hypothetical protein
MYWRVTEKTVASRLPTTLSRLAMGSSVAFRAIMFTTILYPHAATLMLLRAVTFSS